MAVGEQIVIPGADGRLQLVKEPNGNTLVIDLAQESDAGDYTCQVSTYKPIEIQHSVKIRGKNLQLVNPGMQAEQCLRTKMTEI